MMSNSAQITPLDCLRPNSMGKIHAFKADDALSDQLREMGFSEDLSIEVRQESVLGRDPMVVQVGAMTVALRRAEAAHILVALETSSKT